MVLVMLKTWFNRSKAGKPPSRLDYSSSQPQDDTPAPTPAPQSTAQHQQQQPQKNEYSPANTPLQLLSEVATGGNPAQVSRPQSRNQYPPNLGSEWHPNQSQHQNQQPAPVYGDPNSINQMQSGYTPGSTPYGNIDPSLGVGSELDFTLGEGFEQAMGMTLGDGDFQKYFSDDAWLGAMMMDSVAGGGVGNIFDSFS
jgi:hypothetical protein